MGYRVIIILLAASALVGCTQTAVKAASPPVIQTGVDPDNWGRVPAGEFLFGLHEQETSIEYDYEVMVTDVTNEQYAAYLNQALSQGIIQVSGDQVTGYYPGDAFHGMKHEVEIKPGNWLHVPLNVPGLRLEFDGKIFTPLNGFEYHPMTMVTWFGAKAYCEYFGWQLPTEIEWEKAARGTDGRPFPWGNEITRKNANYYSSYDLVSRIFGAQGGTTPVGFYNGNTYDGYLTENSPSPYGMYDIAGNVWQWTNDVYEGTHLRYLRGGGYNNYGYNLRVWTRNNAPPDYYSPSVGFRCIRMEK